MGFTYKDNHELFQKIKGKKVRMTFWTSDMYFIAEGIDDDDRILGITYSSNESHGDSWNFSMGFMETADGNYWLIDKQDEFDDKLKKILEN